MTLVCLLVFPIAVSFAAPPTAGTIARSQDMLRQDEALRQEIEQGKKVFVEKIVLKGASKFSEKEIKDIISPFERNWLTKKDIQQIIDSLKAAYVKKRSDTRHLKIIYEIKKPGTLEIKVNELTR
jgi:hemolysin activation/secretion protein